MRLQPKYRYYQPPEPPPMTRWGRVLNWLASVLRRAGIWKGE